MLLQTCTHYNGDSWHESKLRRKRCAQMLAQTSSRMQHTIPIMCKYYWRQIMIWSNHFEKVNDSYTSSRWKMKNLLKGKVDKTIPVANSIFMLDKRIKRCGSKRSIIILSKNNLAFLHNSIKRTYVRLCMTTYRKCLEFLTILSEK